MTSIGIQPEVSSIYIGAEASSAEDEESGCESEEEYSSEDEDLPFDVEDPGVMAFGLQSPPIEITPFTDDESGNSETRSSPRQEGVEEAPVPTIRTKLTPAKVEKSASMDSTDTVIHVKPEKVEVIEEEKAPEENALEKRRQKKKKKLKTKKTREHELRFLKNCGNQTSPILLDCATQYEIFTTESSSQYDVKGRSRKCQTKLSSINHEQLQGIRETVQKLKRRESEMSRVTNVSESDWESESGAKEEVAEVSLDLSVIALGVDESGKVVEVPKPLKEVPRSEESSQIDDAVPKVSTSPSESMSLVHLDSEDEEIESLEELEMFSTDTGAQTEEKVMVDKQAHTTPRHLEILRNCTTQTTFSTFYLPEKAYESASASSGDEGEDEKEEEHVFFMTNTGVQTMHTSFHLETKQEVVEEELQKDSDDSRDDLPLFLKDSDCQTIAMEMSSCETSTDYVKFAEMKELRDSVNQTAEVICELSDLRDVGFQCFVPDFDSDMQTDEASVNEGSSQTECSTSSASESQTVPVSSSEAQLQTDTSSSAPAQCQTDFPSEPEQPTSSRMETSISETQTDAPSSSEVEVQAILSVDSAPVECQTESVHLDEVEVQTEVEVWTTWAQTEFVAGDDVEMQTDEVRGEYGFWRFRFSE